MRVIPAQAGISVIYPSTSGRHLGSGFRRSDEYTATGPVDAFDTHSYTNSVWKRRIRTLRQAQGGTASAEYFPPFVVSLSNHR